VGDTSQILGILFSTNFRSSLNVPLSPIMPGAILAKPLAPDISEVKNLSSLEMQSLSFGKSNNWTCIPWLCNDGSLIEL